MTASVLSFLRLTAGSLRDLAPIVLVISFFQLAVLRQPFPDLAGTLGGLVLVMFGLTFFVQGLEMGLFPIGERLAHSFARKGSGAWLLTFGFGLGFATTIAEPALIAVAGEAGRAAADAGVIANTETSIANYVLGLRLTVAAAVGRFLIP